MISFIFYILRPVVYATLGCKNVQRSVFWATRELGMTTVELSKKLKLSQPPSANRQKEARKSPKSID
jgi:hypothetical protein